MARSFKTKTFTAASLDVATYLDLDLSRDEPIHNVVPLASVFIELNAAATDLTVEAVLYNSSGVIHRIGGTVANTGRRTALAGAAGGYIGLITWELSTNNMFDQVGHSYEGCKWAIGVTALGATITSATIRVALEAQEDK